MAHFRIMYIHILLLYIQYWCLHAQCFIFSLRVTRNKRRRFRPIRDSDTEMRGSYSAPDWLKQQQQHTHTHTRRRRAGRGVCCSWKVHDSLICLWPRGSRTPRLFTQCGLILSRFGPSGVKVRTLGVFFTRFYRTRNIRGVSGDTKQKETSNFNC